MPIARKFQELGYKIVSTDGTAKHLQENGIACEVVKKIAEGRPNIIDLLKNKEVHLVINTPSGKGPTLDEAKIRSLAVSYTIPCITTISAAQAAALGIEAVRAEGLEVKTIQDYHQLPV